MIRSRKMVGTARALWKSSSGLPGLSLRIAKESLENKIPACF